MRSADERQFPFVLFARYVPLLDNRMRTLIEHPLIALDRFVREHSNWTNFAKAQRLVHNGPVTTAMVYFESTVELHFARQGVW